MWGRAVMKRIVLFRFHKSIQVCRNRIELIRKNNPGIAIYGLYGGSESYFPKVKQELGREFAHLYCIKGRSRRWKWLHGDLAVRLWYHQYGRRVDFDMLHLIEWDLIFHDSLAEIYRFIPVDGVGLTCLVPLKQIEARWKWTKNLKWLAEWQKLLTLARREYLYEGVPHACYGPGACLPKNFLDRYCRESIPEWCHDEVRYPLFAQNFGFKLYDTEFTKCWFSESREQFFVSGRLIKSEVIEEELRKPYGKRAFHPYQRIVSL